MSIKYPYTDFHEMNLDWIISKVKSIVSEWAEFSVINTIKWAGVWDSSKSYDAWSVVTDPNGNGYISIKAVPANVAINNTDYWQLIADFNRLEVFTTPEEYGAVGDGVTDDTNSIQLALNDGRPVIFDNKTYLISLDASNHALYIQDGNRLFINNAVLKLYPDNRSSYSIVYAKDVDDFTIIGGTIYGDKGSNNSATEHCHGLTINGCTNARVEDTKVIYCCGDGIYIGGTLCENVKVNNVLCDNNGRNGLSITCADNVIVSDSIFSNTSGFNPQQGIDIEANSAANPLTNVKILNCAAVGNVHAGIQVLSIGDGDSVEIDGCYVENAVNTYVQGTKSSVIVTNCNIKPSAAATSDPIGEYYGLGSAISPGCANGSTIVFDNITVDLSNSPSCVIRWSERTMQGYRYNMTLKGIHLTKGSSARLILNRGYALHNCNVEMYTENWDLPDSGNNFCTILATDEKYNIQLNRGIDLDQTQVSVYGAYANSVQITNSDGGTFRAINPAPGNKTKVINNSGSAVTFSVVGFNMVGVDGTEVSTFSLADGKAIEYVYYIETGKVFYHYI